ncbi:MAG TPA: 2-amino-4-hydroxy-6-hydroxymethyldihydropteridine diphosphokinase [Terrimesophilobacter sp.]|mgnify:CR=1 FL=1|nr:2-amino-4-hydroxy-6-hydroxymethyldihydropteridine diphosphokinase [Terrimesophilobacter sp.]HRQ00464.1 2-amino-4-hydroxy-6-hydroxymethyldihydropteridine diphosphokinase [Terrimesophilobacter sp.]
MTRMRAALPAAIALGSNQGDREATLRAAVGAISELDGVTVRAASDIVETPALTLHGIDHTAPAYLNAVVLVRSSLTPEQLLAELHRIENDLGRVRTERWGDRTLDLDLIDFAGLTRSSDTLTLPHPRAHERAFVLHPWNSVHADALLPGRGRVADLLATVTDPVAVFDAAPLWPVVPSQQRAGGAG